MPDVIQMIKKQECTGIDTNYTRNEELPGGRTFLVTCYHALRTVYADVTGPRTGKCIRK
jgi:hypothetical protein